MKKTILIFGIALVLLLLLSGCIQPAECNNNGTCDKGENVENCASDCNIDNPPTPGSSEASGTGNPPNLPI